MAQAQERVKVAIVGSGNIGTDLMYKLLARPGHMELVWMAGIDPASEGLARARALGLRTTAEGIGPVLEDPEVVLVFDATSAAAHRRHASRARRAGKICIDLTPAALGPAVVPPVNLGAHLDADEVNLVTCGGQATIPMVHAVARVTPVLYAEMVSTVASRSAGPGTRRNIDEFTFATARGLESIGGAERGKAIIVLNPAEPPIVMTNTVRCVPGNEEFSREDIVASVRRMEAEVQSYVPGYRLKADPVFEKLPTPWGERWVATMLLEVEGAGDFLPTYAGNLDIMTAAARRVGDLFAEALLAGRRRLPEPARKAEEVAE